MSPLLLLLISAVALPSVIKQLVASSTADPAYSTTQQYRAKHFDAALSVAAKRCKQLPAMSGAH
jgi:hypothetical protein